MKTRICKSATLLLALGLGGGVAQANEAGFEYHGYLRTGTGVSKQQTQNSCFTMRNEPGYNPYRLGNECGFYMESILTYNFQKIEPNKPWFRTSLNLALVSDNLQNVESTSNGDFQIWNREVYVEGGNLVSEGSVLWMGKRFYKRRDVGLFDLFLVETNGLGAGLMEINMGPGKGHVAFMQYKGQDNVNFTATDSVSSPLVSTLDLRYDLPMQNSNLETILLYGQKSEKPSLGEADFEYEKLSGYELTLIHTASRGDEFKNTAYLQYGSGLFGSSLGGGNQLNGFESSTTTFPKATGSDDLKKSQEKSYTIRAADELVYNAESWDMASGLVLQQESFGDTKLTSDGKDAEDRQVVMFGIRPSYYLSEIWKVTLDGGYVAIKNNSDAAGSVQEDTSMTKETIALQVQPGKGYASRPSLRFFVTNAQWDKKTQPYLTNNSEIYLTNKQGSTFGVQAEAWW